jgi:phosphoribosylformylglycinamidine (FGAM) synthase PurS component
MAHTHLFEIGYKAGVTDPVGRGLKHDITHLGLAKVSQVASAQLYKVLGKLSTEDRSRITQDLLCDPILNESRPSPYPLPGERAKGEGKKSMVIDVWYKAGVTDAVGDSVRKGIADLGIHDVQDVRTGMRYHLQGVTQRAVAEKIALALLVNPLVHEMTIHAD